MSEDHRHQYADVAHICRSWWQDLQPNDNPTHRRKGDRAALARLRRTAHPHDALFDEATHDLIRRLGMSVNDNRLLRVGVIAHILAHVRSDADASARGRRTLMRAVGWERPDPSSAESAILKPLRLRRLLAIEGDEEEMARELRRVVALAGREGIDVGDLAASIYFWGTKVKTRWAFDYYASVLAAPDNPNQVPSAVA